MPSINEAVSEILDELLFQPGIDDLLRLRVIFEEVLKKILYPLGLLLLLCFPVLDDAQSLLD